MPGMWQKKPPEINTLEDQTIEFVNAFIEYRFAGSCKRGCIV